MKKIFSSFAIFLVFASAAVSAKADTVTLTFEGLGDNTTIGNYYNGGTDGQGNGPGPNYGIQFSSNSLSLVSYAMGGSGNFINAPSGKTVAFFLTGTGDVMNVAAGFDTGFSFYYSSPVPYTGSVTVWSGLNATGSLLATLSLASTVNDSNCPTYACNWTTSGVNFAGIAQSVNFGGSANQIGFDNITLGSATPTSGIPEPASLGIVAVGLLVAAAGSRKFRASTKDQQS